MNSDFAVIIQARRGSSRFKDKIIKKVFNKPLLFHQIKRIQQSKFISLIIIATTNNKEDKVLKRICDISHVPIFYGNTHDVLDRYYETALEFKLSNIVRITADCPVIDPIIIDKSISKFRKDKVDYLSNCLVKTFPEGMSVEVFTFDSLKKAWQESNLLSEREHVTPYIWKNPDIFKISELINPYGNQSNFRLTIDYPQDLVLIRAIYKKLFAKNPFFELKDITDLLEFDNSLYNINKNIPKYEGYKKSLKNDQKI